MVEAGKSLEKVLLRLLKGGGSCDWGGGPVAKGMKRRGKKKALVSDDIQLDQKSNWDLFMQIKRIEKGSGGQRIRISSYERWTKTTALKSDTAA